MVSAEKFKTISAEFDCGFDPRIRLNIRRNWRKNDFKEY